MSPDCTEATLPPDPLPQPASGAASNTPAQVATTARSFRRALMGAYGSTTPRSFPSPRCKPPHQLVDLDAVVQGEDRAPPDRRRQLGGTPGAGEPRVDGRSAGGREDRRRRDGVVREKEG